MNTKLLIAIGAATLALGGTASASTASASPADLGVGSRSRREAPAVPPAYGWPVEPFDRQHPVRAFLNDPRIGRRGSRSFHFGIDVAAPDGTPVYAVTAGTLFFGHGSLAVWTAPGHVFGYWHIRRAPQLRAHQYIRRHQLLGWIKAPWGHVHFAERIGDTYVDPLRPGALGPYTDPVPPTIRSVHAAVTTAGVRVLVAAYDTTWPRAPGAWADKPVTPAVLRWRIERDGHSVGPWHTLVDARHGMLDRRLFRRVYTPGTTQNHEGRAGTYAFCLAHAWHPVPGAYHVTVVAEDERGNRAVAGVAVTVGRR